MTLLMSYSIWILFAGLSGAMEAFYYSQVYDGLMKRVKYDHAIFTFIRAVIAGAILMLTFFIGWQMFVAGAFLMAAFPFFHDGIYYQTRHWLDGVYPKGFFDHTTTSDAKFNFNFTARLLMFLFSLMYFAL